MVTEIDLFIQELGIQMLEAEKLLQEDTDSEILDFEFWALN